jgi:hypothetical protein
MNRDWRSGSSEEREKKRRKRKSGRAVFQGTEY